jgi:HAD superfamily hydrolase (TIGR01549 family)
MSDRLKEFETSIIEVVFFDLDDTIIAPGNAPRMGEEASLNVLRKTHKRLDSSLIDEKYAELSKEMLKESQSGRKLLADIYDRKTRFSRLLDKLGVPDHSLAEHMAEVYWKVRMTNTRLNEGASRVLKELSEVFPLGVVTNGPTKWQETKLVVLGVRSYIKYFVDSETVGYRKPQPEIFTYALEKAGVEANKALMVGDSLEDDVEGAKRVGMRTVWYKCGEPVVLDRFFRESESEKVIPVVPDFEIGRLEELIPILLK